ncbi:alpha-2-macroglobulin family protein [Rhizosphaericola mali]|uniref:Alpha-2-macroglobulin domain-containing protein n=1 Tax=Rhizosphaericola mali TaxID=2545455 RepID=A0A5P2G0G9_9BACT|nr:alpha-2-macroglobulin family protein [Rhizosphaericola mali]QES87310.1 hypothetical protein E0W69_001085 [Rhizosphaericola mali]
MKKHNINQNRIIFSFILSLIFTSHAIMAQSFNYKTAWNKVEINQQNGQFKSLKTDIQTVYNQAKKDNNTQQKIKSILYLSQISWQTSEDDVSENKDNTYETFHFFENEIKTASPLEKAILQNYLAQMYQQYGASVYYKNGNIQQSHTKKLEDFKTWTYADFKEVSDSLFKASISNTQLLYSQKTKDYNILLENNEGNQLSPTIYDILANNYYNNLNDTWNIPTSLKAKFSQQADSILNSLIQIHSNEENKSLFLYYSLIKINRADKNNAEDKIRQLISQYPNDPYTAELYYTLATQILNKKNKLEAHKVVEDGIAKTTKGIYQNNLINLKNEIEKQVVTISTNVLVHPNDNIPVKISHQNIADFNILIYNVTPNLDAIQSKKVKFDNNILYTERETLSKTIHVNLNKFNDYAMHSTIYKIDGLPEGTYKITTDFEKNKDEYSIVRVGTKAITETNINKEKYFQLIDANNGKLVKNEKITILGDTTSKKKYPFTLSTKEIKTIDQNGNLKINYEKNSHDFIINYGNEFIKIPYSYDYSHYNESENNPVSYTAKIFTDRAIYRPGQKIYFKAIAIKSDTFTNSVIANTSLVVTLLDVNQKEIQKQQLTTNEFGSIFGEFILPSSGLTGSFSIHISDDNKNKIQGSSYVRVEEYKRPKFEIVFDSLKNAYTLDKEVLITGKSTSYAGAPISNAKVTYSVTRREVYIWRRFGWFDYYPNRNGNETIANGDTSTNETGKFTIPFIAKTDAENKNTDKRSFIYTIHVDIMDQNGETHSQTQSVTIGDLPYKLQLSIPESLEAKNLNSIKISSQNLNGLPYQTNGLIKITQLKQPERIILPHSNTNVSYQLYDYNQYVNYFPHISYGKEDENPAYYKKGNIVYNNTFNTEKSDSISIEKQLPKGCYLVEASSIHQNDTITDFAIIQLTDENHKSGDYNYFTTKLDKEIYKIGDIAHISIQTDIKEKAQIQFLLGNGSDTQPQTLPFQNGNIEVTHTITKQDLLKGIYFKSVFIKWNDYANSQILIPIETNVLPPLSIQTKTFRDKIEPGKPEKWTIHISGNDKDKFTAEILAGMYDASLDQFASNNFDYSISNNYPILPNGYYNSWNKPFFSGIDNINAITDFSISSDDKILDKSASFFIPSLNWYGFYASEYRRRPLYDRLPNATPGASTNVVLRGMSSMSSKSELNDVVVVGYGTTRTNKKTVSAAVSSIGNLESVDVKKAQQKDNSDTYVAPRTNLQETAFFYPNLLTDKNGDVQLEFTSPEALTKWKLLVFAHNKQMQTGSNTFYTQTQKDLMVVPNLPRFLREKDKMVISTKINNLSAKNLSGKVQLIITDAYTGEILDKYFQNEHNEQAFTANAQQNTLVNWTISIPENHSAVTFKILAKAGNYSDGEENMLPILTNRTMVTETQPISIREGQSKEWNIPNFSVPDANSSKTNFSLSVEMFTNPIWTAVFSLPYLREYPYECSEQLFSRYYASVLSNYIVEKNPTIKRVFDEWNSKGLTTSNLEKNAEIKSILLEESPWILDGQSETEQMRRIALLFDMNKMSNEIQQAFEKLKNRQKTSGGFAWYGDGNEDEYITEYIVQGFGKLKNILGDDYKKYASDNIDQIIKNAIQYIDNYQEEEIKKEQKQKKQCPIQFMNYYYVRSFWTKEFPLNKTADNYLSKTLKSLSKEALQFDLKRKALAALVLERYNQHGQAEKLVRNLKETSVDSDEQGMYWKNNLAGWYWYESPIENQTSNIEAFSEITPQDTASIEAMKVWLMKNKQTNSWSTTKATTEAIYALLHFGKSWMNSENGLTIKLGNQDIYPNKNQSNTSATGYFKQTWSSNQITSDMQKIEVKKTSAGGAYGGVYYQYFEDLNKVKSNGYDIKMEKKLFIKRNTKTGVQLFEISPSTPIKVGDLVTIRIIVRTDRDMQYIHLKDMRAAGFEPVNVLSNYKWQNGAGYYESTRDAATNFFFSYLPKGTYTFDYDVRANNAGVFSNGITTIQNMYAPEMSAHSEGIDVTIQ